MISAPELLLTASSVLLLAVAAGSTADVAAPVDMAVVNGNVITVDDNRPRAEAFAVSGGRIVAVGSTQEILPLIQADTLVIDARGKTITPGFNDAHLHPGPLYPPSSPLSSVDCSPAGVKTMDDLIGALRAKAGITEKGQWVRGSRYQETKLGRHPTRWDLDEASTEHPIRVGHSSGHVSAFNSYALKLAGITKDTPDPAGGGFDRDEHVEPTGVCRESAVSVVRSAGPSSPKATTQEQVEGVLARFRDYASKGITSVQDAGASLSKVKLYQRARERGQPVRIYAMVNRFALSDLKKMKAEDRLGDEQLKLGAIKRFHGNSLSGQTCWLYEPYAGRPDYYGIPPSRSQEYLDERILQIHEAGFQACVHSNGDREIDMVLDAFEKALKTEPRPDARHRIEHCSVVNERILKRIKQLGVVIAPHSYVYEHGDKMEAYGEARWDMMHPNSSAVALGIPVAGTSDSPVSAADPLLRIQSMVTRRSAEGKVYGPKQRVTAEQAIRIWTLGSAYASFDEDVKGSITVGKLADFAVLSGDPTTVPPDEIKDIRVEKTVIGGRIVHDAAPE